MSKQKGDDDEILPPRRAVALERNEAELVDLLGVPRLTERERLTDEIAALGRIIRSDLAALRMRTLRPSDRILLERQIGLRNDRLKLLRQRLEGL